MDRFIGKRLDGRYEINELIGVGGMASVYKAYDIIDERTVAIKILKEEFVANDEFKRRFKNESKAIAVLSHPNIVKVFDVSFGDVLQYIVMEYCDGITLKDYLKQKGVIDWEEASFFFVQILKALEHAHEKGIVHRDIKPQNIILLKDGNIKVADFGIARFSQSEQRTITDKAIGSVHYISPEQARGDATDGKSDIYSVGVMLYEMTTGKLPFQADSAVSVAIMQLQNEPVKPTEINNLIPLGLEQIILTAMQKEPTDRYPTAFDMLKDIEEIRRNPYLKFDHDYHINSTSGTQTRYIPNNDYSLREDYSKSSYSEPKKMSTVKILSIVAAVFVVILGGLITWFAVGNRTAETFECPNFIGKTLEEIQSDEAYADYQFEIEYNQKDGFENNEVYNQKPSAGVKIKSTSKIVLLVNKVDPIKLDDYEKMSFEEAKSALEELGLEVKKVTKNDDEIAEDCVISSYPEAHETVNKGDTITLYVSLGPEKIETEVPDVKGLYYEDAKQTLIDKGFKVDYEDKWIYDSSVPYGYVVSQSPTGDTTAVVGDVVTIYVSKGAEKTTTTTTTAPKTTTTTANNTEKTTGE